MQTSHQKNLSRRHLQNKPQSSKSSSRHLTPCKWTGRLTPAHKFKTILLRKVPSLTMQETLKSGSQGQTAGTETLSRWVSPVTQHVPTWLPAHPTHTQSHQVSLLAPSQVSHSRVSDVPFHKAIYSWHSNTETPGAGASKEDPRVEPLHFYILTIYMHTSLALPPQSSAPAAEPSMSNYLAGSPVFICFVVPKVGSSWLLLCLSVPTHLAGTTTTGLEIPGFSATHPKQNLILNCSLHTELPAPKVFLNNLLIKLLL